MALECPLNARQRDRGAPELAVGPDHDGLLVAARGQRNVGVESGRAGDNLEITAASASLEVSADAPAAFTPGPGEHSALRDHVAGEIEFVAVAGAGEAEIEAVAAGADGVGGAAPNSLTGSVVQRNIAPTGPATGQAGERPRLRVAWRAGHTRHQQGESCEYQPSDDHERVSRAIRSIGAMLPNDRYTVCLQMPHSTSPIQRCH